MLEFELWGVPVSIHASSVVILGLLGWGLGGGVLGLVVWLIVAWLALLVHEGGHALAFSVFGHRPEIEIAGLGGLTRSRSGPFLRPWQHGVVSVAGPGAGFVAGGLTLVLALGVGGLESLSESGPLLRGVWLFIVVNLVWSAFNLLPILPMDGGQALRAFLQVVRPRQANRISRGVSVAFAAGLAWLGWTMGMWFTTFLALLFLFANLSADEPHGGTRH